MIVCASVSAKLMNVCTLILTLTLTLTSDTNSNPQRALMEVRDSQTLLTEIAQVSAWNHGG